MRKVVVGVFRRGSSPVTSRRGRGRARAAGAPLWRSRGEGLSLGSGARSGRVALGAPRRTENDRELGINGGRREKDEAAAAGPLLDSELTSCFVF
ncbi:hypothetical protein SRHO_G00091710 [Serrasalmus rhombeus]